MIACDLIVSGSYLIAMDACDTRILRGGVAIDQGKIIAIDSGDNLRAQYLPLEDIAHENAIILPGLIDAHTHETLTRGLHEDLPLMQWLEEICFPIEQSYEPHDSRAAALMTQLEFIKGGVTTFIDIFRFADQSIEVLHQSGLRGIFSPQFFDVTSDTLEGIDKTVDLIERYHGSGNGRVSVWFGPHAPYSCGPESYTRVAQLAKALNVGIHTHFCETKDELDIIQNKYGQSPLRYLEDLGVFEVPCVLAHAIHLTDEEILQLADKRNTVGLVYNPISNMKLADGVASVPKWIEAGCTAGLGTDSNLSNNGLDMFAEMRIGSYLQKIANDDATIMPCYQMLKMATMGSAKVLHLDPYIGSLEVGKLADVIAVSMDRPHMWPVYYENPSNIIEQIVYSGRACDVITTIVDGRVLMDDYHVRTLDEATSFDFVQQQARSLYKRSFS